MGDQTKIGWTEDTRNWWGGCTKVSAGCKGCYATVATPIRTSDIEWGPGKPRKLFKGTAAKVRAAQNRALMRGPGEPRPRQFWMSLGDWLDAEVPIEWLARLLEAVAEAPDLHHMMLTKRPENFYRCHQALHWLETEGQGEPATTGWIRDWINGDDLPDNVSIGVSMEDQGNASIRKIHASVMPAKSFFISAEPLIGPIDWQHLLRSRMDEYAHWEAHLDLVIIGGESEPNIPGFVARPCNLEWIEGGIAACREIGVPVFVKQLGTHPVIPDEWDADKMSQAYWPGLADKVSRPFRDPGTGQLLRPVVLRHKKGEDPTEWPEVFRKAQEQPRWRNRCCGDPNNRQVKP